MSGFDLKGEVLRLLREDLEFRYAVAGLIGLDEILRRLDRHEEELVKLRKDMNMLRKDMNMLRKDMVEGFSLIRRHIDALGARWGLASEEAFREGIKGILSKELGITVEHWSKYDSDGYVYGYPSIIEVDVALRDGKTIIVEVASHARSSDISILKRKGGLYEKMAVRKVDRIMIVTPYIDDRARELAQKLGIEVYTKV